MRGGLIPLSSLLIPKMPPSSSREIALELSTPERAEEGQGPLIVSLCLQQPLGLPLCFILRQHEQFLLEPTSWSQWHNLLLITCTCEEEEQWSEGREGSERAQVWYRVWLSLPSPSYWDSGT